MRPAMTGGLAEVPAAPSTAYLHLLAVYLIWGSTYFAIRIAVREGAGFPPFWMAGSRVLVAALGMLAVMAMKRRSLRLQKSDWPTLVSTGLLFWLGGNGLVTWAETSAESGYAALLIGSIPLWAALIEAVLDRRFPSITLGVSLIVGFAGLYILTGPVAAGPTKASPGSIVALLSAALCWSLGSIIHRRRPLSCSIEVGAAYQMLVGCVGFTIAALATGEPKPTPTTAAVAAWGYLIVLGTVVAFTSYAKALRYLPVKIVMTYAFVNPIVAVFLGWSLLHEPVTKLTVLGTVLIVSGVAGVFRDRAVR